MNDKNSLISCLLNNVKDIYFGVGNMTIMKGQFSKDCNF